jgi:hypothetical protein
VAAITKAAGRVGPGGVVGCVRNTLRHVLTACTNSEYLVHEFYKPGTTSSVKDVNEPVLLFLTVSEIFNVHLPRVLLPS